MKQISFRRRASVLAATLVCLVIVMALLGSMLVGALRVGRQMRIERDRRQCELLLQAGLDRAALSLREDESYRGEVWDASAAEIGGAGAGQVTIQVSRPSDGPPRMRIQAEYPLGSEHSIRRSRTVQLPTTISPPIPLPKE